MNGKKICASLRELRIRIASANDIDYQPAVCTYEGECSGTCPRCESELRYIERQLSRRRTMGKKVALAGLALGAASLMPMQAQQVTPPTPATTVEQPSRPIVDAAPGDTTAVVIRGRVIESKDREPMIGATVLLKGTKLGTTTDIDGNFAIRVPKDGSLIIKYVGCLDQEYVAKQSVAGEVIVLIPYPKAKIEEQVLVGGIQVQPQKMPAVDADIYQPQ